MRQISVREDSPEVYQIGIAAQLFEDFEAPGASDVGEHSHDMVEMVLVLKGAGTHIVSGHEYPLVPGDLWIIHYGQSHKYRSPGCELINVYLDTQGHPIPAITPELAHYVPSFLPLHSALSHKQNLVNRMQFPGDTFDEIHEILRGILREQELERPGHIDNIRLYYQLLLSALARQVKQQTAQSSPDSGSIRRMESIRRFIDLNFTEPIELDRIADDFNISKGYLCRSFKDHTGMTVIDYVHQRRIEHALIRLMGSDDKILAIAMDCGFQDLSFFNRVFRRKIGCTPSAYRQRMKPRHA